MVESIASEIKAFIVENFMFGQGSDTLTPSQSLLESGVIDSTGLLELVSFIEQRYGVTVADRELVPENLDSVDHVSRYVVRKVEALSASQG